MMKLLVTILILSIHCFPSAINVSSVATAGDGTAASPWTGWDTAITWVGEQQYNFPGGFYAYTTSPNFLKTGIALVGEAGTVLKHTGSGNAVVFDNPGGLSPNYLNWIQNVRFENFIIQGNIATTNGLFLRGVRNGVFKHISIRDVSNAGVWTEACVTNILENFRVTHHEMPNDSFSVVPKYGIVFAARGPDTTTTWTVINPVIEGVTEVGIWAQAGSYGHTFINGTSEGNPGKGAVIDSFLNTFINTDFEANGGTDIELNQPRNTLIGVVSNSNGNGLTIASKSHMNQILSGQYKNISLSGGFSNLLQGVFLLNPLSDSGVNTYKLALATPGIRFESRVGNYLPMFVGLAITGGIVSTDALQSSFFMVTANQNFTLANPVNGSNGQKITWRVWQKGVWQISFGSKFRTAPGKPFPSLTVVAGEFDYISATYNSLRDTWDIQ